MNEERRYVRVDEHGAMRIGHSRVLLDSIVAGFEQGHSPETLQQQYPTLSLEEVYGAITYYCAHTDAVHTYLKRQDELWGAWRAKSATGRVPSLSVCEHCRHQRLPSAHESQDGDLVCFPEVFKLAQGDLPSFYELGRLTRSN